MNEKPIIFKDEMVRAIIEGRKTQTRRVMKPQPVYNDGEWRFAGAGWNRDDVALVLPGHSMANRCPYGQLGDHLWVREAFQVAYPSGSVDDEWIGDELMEVDGKLPKEKPESIGFWWDLYYRADEVDMCKWWRPSIFMPRWASRINLEIVDMRVERLQAITPDDVLAEGIKKVGEGYWLAPLANVPDYPWGHAHLAYAALWNSINDKRGYGWNVNPWVWVIEFKRTEQ